MSLLCDAANSLDPLAARIAVLIDKNGVVRWIDKQINLIAWTGYAHQGRGGEVDRERQDK